jgi:hypothetical protein
MQDIATFGVLLSHHKFLIQETRNANFNVVTESLVSSLGTENYSRHISCGPRRLFSICLIKQHITVKSFAHAFDQRSAGQSLIYDNGRTNQ